MGVGLSQAQREEFCRQFQGAAQATTGAGVACCVNVLLGVFGKGHGLLGNCRDGISRCHNQQCQCIRIDFCRVSGTAYFMHFPEARGNNTTARNDGAQPQ
jgi:hypothetical protein